MRKLSIALLVLAGLALSTVAGAATVKTKGGMVEGTSEDGLAVYRGIPFAGRMVVAAWTVWPFAGPLGATSMNAMRTSWP